MATPKSQAKEPIQLDNVIACRKGAQLAQPSMPNLDATATARMQIDRLRNPEFTLSPNDAFIVLYGQLLRTLRNTDDAEAIDGLVIFLSIASQLN